MDSTLWAIVAVLALALSWLVSYVVQMNRLAPPRKGASVKDALFGKRKGRKGKKESWSFAD